MIKCAILFAVFFAPLLMGQTETGDIEYVGVVGDSLQITSQSDTQIVVTGNVHFLRLQY